MSDANLFEQQAANRRRSAILVAIFLLFFAWIGFGGDLIFHLYTTDAGTSSYSPQVREDAASYRHMFPWFGVCATLLGVAMAWWGWKKGPKEILWATGAWEMIEPSRAEEKVLVNVVEEMAIASGLPRPTVWIIPDRDPNAFATGTAVDEAHVAVTEGLLDTLNRDELQGVVAHEMAHIRNHDVKLMTLLAALVGVMALIADGTRRLIWYGGVGRRRGGGGGKKGGAGALVAILLIAWLFSVILAPIVSRLLALGVSRKREFLADATAAQFTRNPAGLASALRKIEDAAEPTKAIKRGTAHLCIADPAGRRLTHKQGRVANLLATHPPMALRIARLKAMAYQYDKTGEIPEAV
ncbi:MAG: M48 family metallopeptidase [Gemmatimonadota bacterium]|nr:MAG: M48 family metallopeptidase [Gemmatimonadota bacterium]